jgi:ATP-dependent Clp protease protease subunit
MKKLHIFAVIVGLLLLVVGVQPTPKPILVASTVAVAGKVPKIKYDGPIDQENVDAAIKLIEQLNRGNPTAIVLEINSPGGLVDAGFALAKAIEDSSSPVVCVVDGEADSMAFYILQSCTSRYATRRSTLMFHHVSLMNVSGNARQLRQVSNVLAVRSRAAIEHVAQRMGVSPDWLENKLDEGDWWLSASDALKVGVLDDLVPSVKSVVESIK